MKILVIPEVYNYLYAHHKHWKRTAFWQNN
jgi:hypothetical protein